MMDALPRGSASMSQEDEDLQRAIKASMMVSGGGSSNNINPYGGYEDDRELEMLRARQEEELIQQAMDESLKVDRTREIMNNNSYEDPYATAADDPYANTQDPYAEEDPYAAYDDPPPAAAVVTPGRRSRRDQMDDMPPPMHSMKDDLPPPMEPMTNNNNSAPAKNWLYPNGTKRSSVASVEDLPIPPNEYAKKPPPPQENFETGSPQKNNHRRTMSYDDADEYFNDNDNDIYEQYGGGRGRPSNDNSYEEQYSRGRGGTRPSILDDPIPRNDPLYDDSTRRDSEESRRRRNTGQGLPMMAQSTGGLPMMAQSNYEFSTRPRERNFDDIPDTSTTISTPNRSATVSTPNSLLGATTHTTLTNSSWGGIDTSCPPAPMGASHREETNHSRDSWGKLDAGRVANDRGHGRSSVNDRMAYSSYDHYNEDGRRRGGGGGIPDYGGRRQEAPHDPYSSLRGGRREEDDRMAYSSYDVRGAGGYGDIGYSEGRRGRNEGDGNYGYDDRGGRRRNTEVGRMPYDDNRGSCEDDRRRTSRSLSPKRTTSDASRDRRFYHNNGSYDEDDYEEDLAPQPAQQEDKRIPSGALNYIRQSYDTARRSRSPTRRCDEPPRQSYESARPRSRSPARRTEEAPLYPKLDDIMVMTGDHIPTASAVVTPPTPNTEAPASQRNDRQAWEAQMNSKLTECMDMSSSSGAGPGGRRDAAAVAGVLGKLKQDIDPTKNFRAAQAKLARPGMVQRNNTTGGMQAGPAMQRSHTTDCALPRRSVAAGTHYKDPYNNNNNSRGARRDSRGINTSSGHSGRSLSPAPRDGMSGSRRISSMDRRAVETKDWDTKMAAKFHDYRRQHQRSGRSVSPNGRSPVPPSTRKTSRSPVRRTRSNVGLEGGGRCASPSPKRSPIRKTKSTLDDIHRPMSAGGPPGLLSPMDNMPHEAPPSPKQKGGGMFKKLFAASKEKR